MARCGESLQPSNRLVSLRGPVRADEAASHAVKHIAVAARRGRRGVLDKIRSVAGRFAGVGEASTKAFSELPGLDPHGDWPEQG